MNVFPAHPAAAAAVAAAVAVLGVVAVLDIVGAGSAEAQAPPACNAATLGTTACLASTMCACTYQRGGIATGAPAGYRWDCGILRPGCGNPFGQPATLNPYPGPYPHAVGIDRSHRAVTVEQTNTNVNTNIDTNTRVPDRTPAEPAWTGDPLPLLPP